MTEVFTKCVYSTRMMTISSYDYALPSCRSVLQGRMRRVLCQDIVSSLLRTPHDAADEEDGEVRLLKHDQFGLPGLPATLTLQKSVTARAPK